MNQRKLKKIYLAGHNGMVGRAIYRLLSQNFCQVFVSERDYLDLRVQSDVNDYVRSIKPDLIIICAAKVGGILANQSSPADFIYDNTMIEMNLINAANKYGVQDIIFLGSSCIYPKITSYPIRESALLTGSLEPTNESYAIAKIMGIKTCQAYNQQYGRNYKTLQPTNLYGPFDNFDERDSHVIPGLIRRMHNAKIKGETEFYIWGSGRPLREFLHVDDLASAVMTIIDKPALPDLINVGSGEELTIEELANQIKDIIGFQGTMKYSMDKPDGTMRKTLDSSLISATGWKPKIKLKAGLIETYSWFLKNIVIN